MVKKKTLKLAVASATLLGALSASALDIVWDPISWLRDLMEDLLTQVPIDIGVWEQYYLQYEHYDTVLENLRSLPKQLRAQVETELHETLHISINDWGQSWQNYHVMTDPFSEGYRDTVNEYMTTAFATNGMPRTVDEVLEDIRNGAEPMEGSNTLANAKVDRNRYETSLDSMRQVAIARANAERRQEVASAAASELSQLPEKSELRASQLNGVLATLTYQQLEDMKKLQADNALRANNDEIVMLAQNEDARARSIQEARKMIEQPIAHSDLTSWAGF